MPSPEIGRGMIWSSSRMPRGGRNRRRGVPGLRGLQVRRGGLAGLPVVGKLVAYLLTFREILHAGAFDRADMDEHVVAAIVGLDENPKPFVELNHFTVPTAMTFPLEDSEPRGNAVRSVMSHFPAPTASWLASGLLA